MVDESQGARLFYSWGFLTVAEIARVTEMPRKVALLVEQGVIQPCDPEPGKGRSRLFSIWHALLFRIAFDMERLGVKPTMVRQFMGVLGADLRAFRRVCELYLFRDGADLIVRPALVDDFRLPSAVLMIDVWDVFEDLIEAVEALHPEQSTSIEEARRYFIP